MTCLDMNPNRHQILKTHYNTPRPLFTKHLNPGLICELCNPFYDWVETISSTNHPAGHIICRLIQELKNLVNKAIN